MPQTPLEARALHSDYALYTVVNQKWPTIFVNGQPNLILLGHMTIQFQIVISSTVISPLT